MRGRRCSPARLDETPSQVQRTSLATNQSSRVCCQSVISLRTEERAGGGGGVGSKSPGRTLRPPSSALVCVEFWAPVLQRDRC